MSRVEEIRKFSWKMDAPALLRFLITEKFPQKTAATCSLRGRSLVLLKLISEIDPATPIVFCHAPNIFPESLDYRAMLVEKLGLKDIREPAADEGEPLAGDCDHHEGLWAENPDDHTRAYSTVHLNRTLKDFDCWISGVYHGPYTDAAGPRVKEEGRLIRVSPLATWTADHVRRFCEEHEIPYHPQARLRRSEPAKEQPKTVPTYHF